MTIQSDFTICSGNANCKQMMGMQIAEGTATQIIVQPDIGPEKVLRTVSLIRHTA